MSTLLSSSFRTDAELLAFLKRHTARRGGNLAVVAGHYCLLLDPVGCLRPAIWEDIHEPEISRWLRRRVGDIPTRSFRLGARLLHHCAVSSSTAAHLLVLVHDHNFLAPPSQPSPSLPGPADSLRRQYYSSPSAFPASFRTILAEERLTMGDALWRWEEMAARPPAGLPLHSAEVLRQRFDLSMSDPLQYQPVVANRLASVAEGGGPTADIGTAAGPPPHFTAANGCSYAGEVLQLILDAAHREVTDLVLFIAAGMAREAALGADLAPPILVNAGLACPTVHLVSAGTPVQNVAGGPGPLSVATHAA